MVAGGEGAKTTGAGRKILCSFCGVLTNWENNPWRPFCTERCKLADLGAWAGGDYRIPTDEVPGSGEPEE